MKCENGHLLLGNEDLQELEDGSVVVICPKCVELDEKQDNASMSRCAGDYSVSVRF